MTEMVLTILSVVSLFGGLFFLHQKILRSKLFASPKVSKLADTLPFNYIGKDGKTIYSTDGVAIRILKITGLDNSIATDAEQLRLQQRKTEWLNYLAKNRIETRVFSVRDKIKVDLSAEYDNKVLQDIHNKWMQGFDNNFVNSHFIMFSVKQSTNTPLEKIRSISSSFLSYISAPAQTIHVLNDSVERTIDMLPEYGAEELSAAGKDYHSILTFLARLTNGKKERMPQASDCDIAQAITATAVEFSRNDGLVTFNSGFEKKFSSILSLKCFGQQASSDMVDDILSLPTEMIVVHNFIGLDKQQSKAAIKSKQTEDNMLNMSQNTAMQYNAALEELDNGATLFKYQLHFQLIADDKQQLANLTKLAKTKFAATDGAQLIQETTAVDKIWYSQLPYCESQIRTFEPFSNNVATLLQFHNEYIGNFNSDWGRGPVRMYKTITGAPYFFTLHIDEQTESLGHMLMVGISGSGKTSMLQHLIGGILRFSDVSVYNIDRNHGALISTEACGGVQANLSDTPVINPCLLDDTSANRSFLHNFILGLTKCEDIASQNIIQNAVDIIFALPKQKRILSNIYAEIFPQDSKVYAAMAPWVGSGHYARWFNGCIKTKDGQIEAYNALDLNDSRFITFEMAEVLKDDNLCMSMCYFLLHIINQHVTYNSIPHAFFIDEANKMLRHPYFKQHTADMLEEQRKKRGAIGLIFQTPDKIAETGIANTILGQCKTRILFRDRDADFNDYQMFNLSEAEFAFIKNQNKLAAALPYAMLVKKGANSVILDIDLSPLGPLLNIYKSGTQAIAKMRTIKLDANAGCWVNKYLEAACA